MTISCCGVSFNVWEKPNADGRASGVYDWTCLMGRDKKILLEKLPPKLDGIITQATSGVVIKLWKVQYPNIQVENNILFEMYYVRLSHLSRLKHKHRENLDQ
jgi:hypothetical protein